MDQFIPMIQPLGSLCVLFYFLSRLVKSVGWMIVLFAVKLMY